MDRLVDNLMRYFFAYSTLVLLTSCSPNNKKKEEHILRSEKPNIIFFITVDMYPKIFNCLPEGKDKNLTPNIDRLAT